MLAICFSCAYVCLSASNAVAYSFVFFQAEDGIRDIGVTGVQTCALPISELLRRTLAAALALCWLAGPVSSQTPPAAEAPPTAQTPQSPPAAAAPPAAPKSPENGRASWRERVKISVVAVSFKTKKRQANEQ